MSTTKYQAANILNVFTGVTETAFLFASDQLSDFVWQYLHLQKLTVDNHAFEKIDDMFTPLSLCQELYRHANISPANETFDIDPHVETGLYHTLSKLL